jgi:phosphoglycolate phosphatase-like HAD superfamily hydrolase
MPPGTVLRMRVLVLWDLDHTLLDAAGVGVRAFATAFKQVFNLDLAALPQMAGRTDLAITLDALRAHGLPESSDTLEALREAAEAAFAALDGELRALGRAMPGAADALDALGAMGASGVAQSVLTGNIRALAEAKTRAFGLDGYLDLEIGAYGWSHAVRARLVELARAAASGRHGDGFAGRRTVLVGDTPRDVEAALATGASVVGVATGRYTVAELAGAGAHAVLPDLTATGDVVATVLRVAAGSRTAGPAR